MVQNTSLSPDNDLLNHFMKIFEDYKQEVNSYTMRTIGEYACNIAEYVAENCQNILREKYFALWQLTHNELIHNVITNCNRSDYERANRYLSHFIGLHGIIQSITIRNNLKQNILTAAKDRSYIISEQENKTASVLLTASSNKQVVETGSIAFFYFELADKKGKIGTMTVGISLSLFHDVVETAMLRIPSFCSMHLVNGNGNILYPVSASSTNKELLNKVRTMKDKESGYFFSEIEQGHAYGHANISKLPFPVITQLTIVCELKVVNDTRAQNTEMPL